MKQHNYFSKGRMAIRGKEKNSGYSRSPVSVRNTACWKNTLYLCISKTLKNVSLLQLGKL